MANKHIISLSEDSVTNEEVGTRSGQQQQNIKYIYTQRKKTSWLGHVTDGSLAHASTRIRPIIGGSRGTPRTN